MAWSRNSTLLTGLGAALAAAAGYFFTSRRKTGGGGRDSGRAGSAAISGSGAHGAVGHTGGSRQSGPDAMRDPPSNWSHVDEASDESFPASDPPAVKHVD